MGEVNKEILANGKVLRALRDRFLAQPSFDLLMAVFRCLIDSDLWVPMNAIISEEDIMTMKNAKKDDVISLKENLRMQPDWLQNKEDLFFPIFSSRNEATKEYRERFSWINLQIDTCIKFAENKEGCAGIVLDAFTKPIAINIQFMDLLKAMRTGEGEKEALEKIVETLKRKEDNQNG